MNYHLERYLFVCRYTFHGKERLTFDYFPHPIEAELFFAHILNILPCVVLQAVSEQMEGLFLGGKIYHYRLSDQIKAHKAARKNDPLAAHFLCLPAPLKDSHLVTFLRPLRQVPLCEQCAPVVNASSLWTKGENDGLQH